MPQVLLQHMELEDIQFYDSTFAENLNPDVSNTNLSSEDIFSCHQLAEFGNTFRSLRFYKNLRKLAVGGRNGNLSHCPEDITKLTTLQELNIFDIDLVSIPESMSQLKNLRILSLSNCELSECPEVVTKLTTLRELNLEANRKLKSLPDSLAQLSSSLLKLNVSECDLLFYPQVVSELTELQELNLSWNHEVTVLPPSVTQLTNLRMLDVRGCGFPGYPDIVSKMLALHMMPALQHIHFQTRLLSPQDAIHDPSLFDEIDHSGDLGYEILDRLHEFSNVRKLDLSHCKLIYFPEGICQVTRLRELHMKTNYHLGVLPETLSQLRHLRVLDIGFCGLKTFPEIVCQLVTLEKLNINGNLIETLPDSLDQLENLHKLNVANCGLTVFPDVICKLPKLQLMLVHGNLIKRFSEASVKHWHEHDFHLFNYLQRSFDIAGLEEPPFKIFQKGPKACLQYYNSIKASSMVNQSLLSVQVLGKTGSGKSSLIRTLQKGKSHLVDPSDRTIVVDTIEVKQDGISMQITDFGGHDIYDLTCPLFLRASNIATFVAVKLVDYSEERHDNLVTKWLSTALAHMKTGHICIVATQIDLCEKQESKTKMEKLKANVSQWIEAELKYIQKLNQKEDALEAQERQKQNISFLKTSSKTLAGIEDLKLHLSAVAKENSLVLPMYWSDMYRKILDQQYDTKRYLKIEEASSMFKKSLSLTRRLFDVRNDFHLCLQLLHDMGMLLWYSDNESLKDVVFHKISFLVTVLQCLFRNDLQQYLLYDHDRHGKFISTQVQFETEMEQFCKTGILLRSLLRCIWETIDLHGEDLEKLIHILRNLDLCYFEVEEAESKDGVLRFPWFIQREDTEGILDEKWSNPLPSGTIQYSLVYSFFHKVPSTLFERFCVRMHKHLIPGGHIRHDWRNTVYIVQDDVQVLFQRILECPEPCVQIHVRSPVSHLVKLKRLLLALCADMDKLCSELPGIVLNAYFLCPHCLLTRRENPIRKSTKQLSESCSVHLDSVPCNPHDLDSEKIPAAMIFLALLDSKKSEHHLKIVQEYFAGVNEKIHPTLPDDLLLSIAKFVTGSMELHLLGAQLGIREHTIDSILYDYREINEAGYRLLLHWRTQRVKEQKNETEMKEELKTALCSRHVGMNRVVAILKEYF